MGMKAETWGQKYSDRKDQGILQKKTKVTKKETGFWGFWLASVKSETIIIMLCVSDESFCC